MVARKYEIGQTWLAIRDEGDCLYTFEVIAVLGDRAVAAKLNVNLESSQVYVFDSNGVEVTDPIFGTFTLTDRSRARPRYVERNTFDELMGCEQ